MDMDMDMDMDIDMEISIINRLLWTHDLMETGCNQSEGMEEIYLPNADDIAGLMELGMGFEEALRTTFEEAFFESCLDKSPQKERLDGLLNEIRQIQSWAKL